MKTRLWLSTIWSLCLMALAALFIKNSYQWFIVPFAVMTVVSSILSAVAGVVNDDQLSRVALRVHGFLFLPWYFGMQWGGGNDGPGLAWFLIVGAGCMVAALLGLTGRGTLTCKLCGETTPEGAFAAWQFVVSICFFPFGLLSLLFGRKPTACQHCGHSIKN